MVKSHNYFLESIDSAYKYRYIISRKVFNNYLLINSLSLLCRPLPFPGSGFVLPSDLV